MDKADLRPANYTLLERKPCIGRDGQNIVMCKVDGYQPFVTWVEINTEDHVFFVHGHYYATLDKALADFADRN